MMQKTNTKRLLLEYNMPVIGAFVPATGKQVDIHNTIKDERGRTLHLSLNQNAVSRILEMEIEGVKATYRKWMYASDVIVEEVEHGVGQTCKYREGLGVRGSLWLS